MSDKFSTSRNLVSSAVALAVFVALTGFTYAGQVPTDPALSTVIATDAVALGNGVDAGVVTVTLRDSSSAPVPGRRVTLAVVLAADPSAVTITPQTTETSDANGQVLFNVVSLVSQDVVFEATVVSDEL